MRTTRSASFDIVFSLIFSGHVMCPIRLWLGQPRLVGPGAWATACAFFVASDDWMENDRYLEDFLHTAFLHYGAAGFSSGVRG